jgi:hypothetical protein
MQSLAPTNAAQSAAASGQGMKQAGAYRECLLTRSANQSEGHLTYWLQTSTEQIATTKVINYIR